MDKIFFPYNIINEHFANDEPINTANNAANNAVNTGTSAVNAGKDTVNNAVNAGKDTVNNAGTSGVTVVKDNYDNKIVVYVRTIVGIIILIASLSMAIYRIKKHADINKGEYENAGYIFGVILISFCCNMCYLPYAVVYSFVFKQF